MAAVVAGHAVAYVEAACARLGEASIARLPDGGVRVTVPGVYLAAYVNGSRAAVGYGEVHVGAAAGRLEVRPCMLGCLVELGCSLALDLGGLDGD